MVTDRYQRLRHHDTTAELLTFAADAGLTVVAVDNVPGAVRLEQTALPRDCLLIFGQEGPASPTTRRPAPPSPCRSRSSDRPAASTPRLPRASPCTPGSLNMGTFPTPGRAGSTAMDQVWANRAASAEAAIAKRHLKKLWGLPGTQLGCRRMAGRRGSTATFGTWHYWWQAHLLDCLVDAQVRDPQPDRQHEDRPPDPRTSAAQQRILGQRLLRRHGVAGAGAGAGRPAGRGRAPEGAEETVRAVPQRVGARGRRRHPVAQAGPVLQRPGQRARGDLPGPL